MNNERVVSALRVLSVDAINKAKSGHPCPKLAVQQPKCGSKPNILASSLFVLKKETLLVE